MQLFYAPDITKTPFLPEEESLHCVKVLRMREGDELNVIDGRGGMYRAHIVSAHQKRTEIEICETTKDWGKKPFNLHLAVAPTKNIDRFEWFVEKATEIGFDTLTPIECRYSERRIIKPERIEKILISAAKQSLKAYIPALNPMIDFRTFMTTVNTRQRFIAHCYDMPKQYLLNACQPGGDVTVMIGPEGDFSEQEVEIALQNGFAPVSLGKSRLRTETAGVVACHLVTVSNTKL